MCVRLTSMLRKLGVGQNLLAELQPISVLLVLVASLQKERKEERKVVGFVFWVF